MKDNFDDILDQLKDSSGELKSNLHILEEKVPVEEQMRYFEYSRRIRSEQEHADRNYLVAMLFTPSVAVEDKRYCLSMLAGLIDVGAYRALETYHSSPLEPELTNWSALALIESQILLDSDFSGEKQFLISTGLGGGDGKLRFFVIVASKSHEKFTDLQQEIINREFNFQFENNHVIVEDYSFVGNYLKILLLSDLKVNLKDLIKEAVLECNEFGDFIDEKFIITNIKQFNDEEIGKLLNKNASGS